MFDLDIYPRKMVLSLENEFLCPHRSFRPEIDPLSISAIFKQNESFHFQNFRDVLMRKQQQPPPPPFFNFAKIFSERISRIKTKSYKVWASKIKRFQNGSCETGDPGLRAHPPPACIFFIKAAPDIANKIGSASSSMKSSLLYPTRPPKSWKLKRQLYI